MAPSRQGLAALQPRQLSAASELREAQADPREGAERRGDGRWSHGRWVTGAPCPRSDQGKEEFSPENASSWRPRSHSLPGTDDPPRGLEAAPPPAASTPAGLPKTAACFLSLCFVGPGNHTSYSKLLSPHRPCQDPDRVDLVSL